MTATAKPAWLLGPATGPIGQDVSRRIDVLRIILIVFIVLTHGGRRLTILGDGLGGVTAYAYTLLSGHFAHVSVPLFFAISGYLFLRKFELSLAAYTDMLGKKFLSIAVPYLLFNAGLILWLYFVGSIDMIGSRSFLQETGILANLTGIGALPINYPLWFLRDLLLVFLISPVFLLLFKEAPSTGLIALFVLWAGLSPTVFSFFGNMFAFYLGGYVARSEAELAGVSGWQRTGFWLFLALAVVLTLRGPLGLTDEGVYQFAFKVEMVLGIVGFWRLSAIPAIRDSRLLHSGGRYSFFIYLAHEPTVSILQSHVLAVWTPGSDGAQLAFYLGSAVVTVAFLWGLGAALNRLSPGLFGLLTGSRRPRTRPVAGPQPAAAESPARGGA